MDFFLCVIGMVMIIEGLPYFIAPEKMQEWLATLDGNIAPIAAPDRAVFDGVGTAAGLSGPTLIQFSRDRS